MTRRTKAEGARLAGRAPSALSWFRSADLRNGGGWRDWFLLSHLLPVAATLGAVGAVRQGDILAAAVLGLLALAGAAAAVAFWHTARRAWLRAGRADEDALPPARWP